MVNVKIVSENKAFWKSKTFQLGALAIIGGVITLLTGNIEAGIPITGMSVLMMFMRSISSTSVKFSKDAE